MAVAPVGLLVLRAWVEGGSERPLRVEVRLTADSGRGFERELMFSEPAAVEALVRAWLDGVLAGDAVTARLDAEMVTPRSRPAGMMALHDAGRGRGRIQPRARGGPPAAGERSVMRFQGRASQEGPATASPAPPGGAARAARAVVGGPARGRRLTAAAAALVVLALPAALALPGAASAVPRGATMFVHSAKSGDLQGGRLTLRGVGRKLTWVSNGGRSGVVSVARLHRRLFLPGTPPATGALHVAGQRPGRELALELSRPRHNASRQTVSYRVKRLDKRPVASRAGRASQRPVPRRFGPASLSIIGAPAVLGSTSGGNDCYTHFSNNTQGYGLQAVSDSNWPDDTWNPAPTGYVESNLSTSWESDGGLLRGCSASAVWQIVTDAPDLPPVSGAISFTTTYLWSGSYTNSCTSSNPQFSCQNVGNDAGDANWWINRSH